VYLNLSLRRGGNLSVASEKREKKKKSPMKAEKEKAPIGKREKHREKSTE